MRVWSSIGMAIGVAVFGAGLLHAEQSPNSPAAAVKNAMNQALNDPHANIDDIESQLRNDLHDAGWTDGQIKDAIKGIDKAKKEGQDLGQGQNQSGTGDWPMGTVVPTAYKVNFPLTNNCKVATKVTIQYPTTIPLTGQTDITVPPKSTTDVAMTLYFDRSQPPSGMTPGAADQPMYKQMTDTMTVTHPSSPGGTKTTPEGTYTYVCNAMKRTYSISLTLVWAPPTSDINDKPQGGKPTMPGARQKKKTTLDDLKPPVSTTCGALFSQGLFVPDAGHASPSACQGEVRNEMSDFISTLQPLKQQNPAAWSFLPDQQQLQNMSLEDMLAVRHKAVQLMPKTGSGR